MSAAAIAGSPSRSPATNSGELSQPRWIEAIGWPTRAFARRRGGWRAQDVLDEAICEWTRQRTVDQVEQTLQAAGVPAHRASTVQDAHEDPQLAHREHWWMNDHPAIGEMSYESPSWRLSDTPPPKPSPSPLLGQHSEYVYRELCGYSEAEFQQLIVDGVVE